MTAVAKSPGHGALCRCPSGRCPDCWKFVHVVNGRLVWHAWGYLLCTGSGKRPTRKHPAEVRS